MTIASGSDLAAAIAAGIIGSIAKASMTTEGAGTWQSLWKATGQPSAGANPPARTAGSGYVPTKDTTGAFSFGNPTPPTCSYLAQLRANSSVVGSLYLIDRLWHCSGFNSTTLTSQSITTPGVLPTGRNPNDGADVEPWIEIYGAPGATTANWDLTGTDALGATSKTWRYVHPANAETVGQMAPMFSGGSAPATCHGIRAPSSMLCSASSGTAGDFGVTLIRRLCELPMNTVNMTAVLDAIGCGLPRIYDDSCLALMVLCSSTTSGLIQGGILIGQK
jgi:hypothetical protein